MIHDGATRSADCRSWLPPWTVGAYAGRKEIMENDSRVVRQYIRSTVYGPEGKKPGGCPYAFVTQPTFIAAVAVVAIGAVYFLRK